MKRPSFQFYPGDWQANSNLRRCSHAEKGAWLDVMCLLHDQPEYGQLRWPLKEIAQAIGATPALVRGLVAKGVLKGDDKQVAEPFIYTPRSGRKDGEPVTLVPIQPGPLWYSSRMVKDEYVRTIRGESSRFGDGKGDDKGEASKGSPKPPLGDGSSSSSSSSTSVERENAGASLTAGEASRAMRQAGLADVNPSHPTLIALVKAGITAEELQAAALEAVRREKGFAYALATAEGQRRDAAKVGNLPARKQAEDWTAGAL